MTTKLLRLRDVLAARGCSRSKLYNDIRDGHFPPPVKIGCRTSAWLESDLEQEVAALVAARDAKAAAR